MQVLVSLVTSQGNLLLELPHLSVMVSSDLLKLFLLLALGDHPSKEPITIVVQVVSLHRSVVVHRHQELVVSKHLSVGTWHTLKRRPSTTGQPSTTGRPSTTGPHNTI